MSTTEYDQEVVKLTEDNLLGGRVTLLQPSSGYRAGIDPVMLAASCKAAAGDRVLDVGAGAGAASLCLRARVPGIALTGLELAADHVNLANRSAVLSGFGADMTFLEADVLGSDLSLPSASFDAVLTNPPFHDAGSSRALPGSPRARATVLSDGAHATWFATCFAALRPKGQLYVIFRADRLDFLLSTLRGHAGDIHVMPLWPKAGVAAKRVLLKATRGSRARLTLHPGITLHNSDGSYTELADAILRDAMAIDWDQA